MDEAGYIEDCLGYARARLSVFIQVWTWSSSQTTNYTTPSGMGLLVCGAGSHPSYHLGVVKKDVQTGVNLNQYAGPGSLIRWHSPNEPLFGPQNSPKLIVSLSLGNSVEFMVRRRAPGNVPSSIRLDHGDILVMDGLARSEYEHCTASGLQGPRVNLNLSLGYTTHGVLSSSRRSGLCAPNVCARFSRAKFPLVGRRRKLNCPLLGDRSSFC